MTVAYTASVATTSVFYSRYIKLLFRWKGSIYKMVTLEFWLYFAAFYFLKALHLLVIARNDAMHETFKRVVFYCFTYRENIPVTFVLGFYVTIVVGRWWDQWIGMPWPDSAAIIVAVVVDGNGPEDRKLKRTLVRYINLSYLIVLTSICKRTKQRYPTLQSIVDAGHLTSSESQLLLYMSFKIHSLHSKFWMPIVWASLLATEARQAGKIKDDVSLQSLIICFNNFRCGCQRMLDYEWVNIPLVYTQVLALATYLFLATTLGGSQHIFTEQTTVFEIVLHSFPVFTFLQFVVVYGWLKVGESLINPYGEDDDDFDVDFLIDRYFGVSYLMVDEMHDDDPKMTPDIFWKKKAPVSYNRKASKFEKAENGTDSAAGTFNSAQDEVPADSHLIL